MKQRQGFNNTHLRNRNRGLVLQAVACGDALSRIEIARRIGLTKMTVSNIVAEWIAEGVLAEKEVAETAAVGRNPVILEVREDAPRAVGLYLSRGAASVIVSTLTLEVTWRKSLPLAGESTETLLEKIFQLIDGALAHLGAASLPVRCMGIGVSAIGPLDAASGTILRPTDFFGIRQLPLAGLLGERYGLPVVVNNDMNASALAEKLYGTGRAFDNFLYLGVTNGIGGGILSGGRLYQDNSGFVGEIGHMSIDFNGPLCSCGRRGCLEAYATMPLLLDRLQAALGRAVTSADLEEAWASPSGRPSLRMWPTSCPSPSSTPSICSTPNASLSDTRRPFPRRLYRAHRGESQQRHPRRGLQIHRGRALPFRAGRPPCRQRLLYLAGNFLRPSSGAR